jgi:hypothetical protein
MISHDDAAAAAVNATFVNKEYLVVICDTIYNCMKSPIFFSAALLAW